MRESRNKIRLKIRSRERRIERHERSEAAEMNWNRSHSYFSLACPRFEPLGMQDWHARKRRDLGGPCYPFHASNQCGRIMRYQGLSFQAWSYQSWEGSLVRKHLQREVCQESCDGIGGYLQYRLKVWTISCCPGDSCSSITQLVIELVGAYKLRSRLGKKGGLVVDQYESSGSRHDTSPKIGQRSVQDVDDLKIDAFLAIPGRMQDFLDCHRPFGY